MNDRSPLVLGLKFLALIIFVCTVIVVVRIAGNSVSAPVVEDVELERNAPSSLGGAPDVRF